MATWFKLDNAAKIYPPILTRHWAAMFRMSVDLSENVDVKILEEAHKKVIKRFPSFACKLKAGFFWYYLERIDGTPPIVEDIDNPIQKINARKNNGFLYRLLYYKNRIAVEIFHSVTDGTGAMTFLLTLVNEYCHLKYGTNVESSNYILNVNEEPNKEELEDAFFRYSKKASIPLKEERSYKLPATPTEFNKLIITSGIVDTNKLKEVAKKYNTTVSIFSGALVLYSAYLVQQQYSPNSKRKIKISIPVNLRRFFPSKTLRNFSSFINPGIYPQLGKYSFEEVLEQVKHFVGLYVNEKQLNAKFSFNVNAEKNIIIRLIPLFIKIPVLQYNYYFTGDDYYCTTISNIGLIKLPEELEKYVDRIDFMLGRQFTSRIMCGCASYKGKTVFNFTKSLQQSDLERYFFTTLIQMGVPVYIESNGGN